jgi:hypothetical protein
VPQSTQDPTRGLPAPARAGIKAAGSVLGAAFGAVSRLRRAKSLHPYGVVFAAELEVHGRPDLDVLAGVPLLTEPATHEGIVRFSRSLGLPRPAPDFMGIALRLADAHGPGRPQDVLLVSSGDGAVIHHVFAPARSFYDPPYSSVLPFRGDDGAFVLGARLAPGSVTVRDRATELEDLAAAAATGGLRYELGVAPISGRLTPVATLRVGDRLPDSANGVRFNPWNTGGGLEPTGPINRMRERVYPGSQAGWSDEV